MAAHRQPAYRWRDTGNAGLQHTERLTDRTLILPVFHELDTVSMNRVINTHPCRRQRGGQVSELILIAASGLAREVLAMVRSSGQYDVVGLLDDDKEMAGVTVDGAPVLGTIDDAPEVHARVCAGVPGLGKVAGSGGGAAHGHGVA